MGYADLSTAMSDIGLDVNRAEDAVAIARLARIDDEIALLIDLKCGRSFGGIAKVNPRVIPLPVSRGHRFLLLPSAIRSVSGVEIVGKWPETLAITDVSLTLNTELTADYHAIQRIDGYTWPMADGETVLIVTGHWSSDPDGEPVPDAIINAATALVVEEWRLRASSPAGEIGFDGMAGKPRDAWKFDVVKTAIDHYRVAISMAGF